MHLVEAPKHSSTHKTQTHGDLIVSRATKAAHSPDALFQLLDLHHLWGIDALQNQLRNTIALLDVKARLSMVEQQNLDFAAIIGVDDTSAGIDKVLRGEA